MMNRLVETMTFKFWLFSFPMYQSSKSCDINYFALQFYVNQQLGMWQLHNHSIIICYVDIWRALHFTM